MHRTSKIVTYQNSFGIDTFVVRYRINGHISLKKYLSLKMEKKNLSKYKMYFTHYNFKVRATCDSPWRADGEPQLSGYALRRERPPTMVVISFGLKQF